MQFVYHEKAGETHLDVDVREYEHLFKVRRMGIGAHSFWRNLDDDILFEYTLKSIGKKEATLALLKTQHMPIRPLKSLHVAWCVIDPKVIEKTLPMLNELGVERLSFVYAEFSQKNHKLDYDRMQRILINSCQQCGRSTKMILEEFSSLSTYFKAYPHSSILDFSEVKLDTNTAINSILIGPEGGFSAKEREVFHQKHIVGLTCNTILRSETAVVSVASKILA